MLSGEAFNDVLEQVLRLHGSLTTAGEALTRPAGQSLARWVVLVEGYDADIVQQACTEALGPKALEAHGAEPGSITGIYALHYAL